jgi:hypothetical protein
MLSAGGMRPGGTDMMAAVYATMLTALACGWLGRQGLALGFLLLCLVLAVWLFLWEIWSPEYGFRMPWLQSELRTPAGAMA